MSNAEITAPKQRVVGVPFKPGQSGNPAGRPKGARNRLADAFIEDLRDAWNEHGADALARCAVEEPAQFCKIVSSLMPRDLNVNIGLNPAEFVKTFRDVRAALGNTDPVRLCRRPLLNQPLIEHNNVD